MRVHCSELVPARMDGADQHEEGGWRHSSMPRLVDSLIDMMGSRSNWLAQLVVAVHRDEGVGWCRDYM
jgi:hypothetical protein